MQKFLFFVIVLVFLETPFEVYSRECPSKLNAHNFDISETLSLGAEIRLFYLGVDVGENLPISGITSFDNNYFGGLRLSMTYFPLSELSVVVEGELRYKNPGWVTNEGFSARPWQGYVAYDSEHFFTDAGLQIIQFGTGAILDERFIGVGGGYKDRYFELSLLFGMTHNWFLRSTSNCLWVRYTSQTEGWKTISNNLNNYAIGIKGGLKLLKPHQLQILYLYSHPSFERLRSNAISLYAKGPVIKRRLSYVVEPVIIFYSKEHKSKESGYPVYGVVGEIRYHIPLFKKEPQFTIGIATVLNDVPIIAVNPVYENLSWGYLKRYSLHQGHIGEMKTIWELSEHFKLYANYFIQSLNYSEQNASDELDAGIISEFKKGLITLNTSFVALNMAGPYLPSYGVYIEVRTIIGKE